MIDGSLLIRAAKLRSQPLTYSGSLRRGIHVILIGFPARFTQVVHAAYIMFEEDHIVLFLSFPTMWLRAPTRIPYHIYLVRVSRFIMSPLAIMSALVLPRLGCLVAAGAAPLTTILLQKYLIAGRIVMFDGLLVIKSQCRSARSSFDPYPANMYFGSLSVHRGHLAHSY